VRVIERIWNSVPVIELIEMVSPTPNPVVSNTSIEPVPAGTAFVMKVPTASSVTVVV
jgi:hypothetical protein